MRIHCDYGREFDYTLFKDLCKLYDIKITFSSVKHPQSNGLVERFHSTLLEMIRANITENPNDHPLSILPYAIICYNNSVNRTHGTIFKSITGNLDAEDGEYYANCINKLSNDEHQIENLLKNQISVTTSVIKNFNATIQKLQIDEQTFNNDIKIISDTIYRTADKLKIIETTLKYLEKCELLMESYLYVENQLDEILNSITFARLKIIHSSIISPESLITALHEISQNLHQNNLPLITRISNVGEYLNIMELEAFQTNSDLVFVLKIPLTDQSIYTLFRLFPIPILNNRTGLYHILSTSQKYIARDDDSLMYIPMSNLDECKPLFHNTLICSNQFAYPIDNNAMCEAQILKSLKVLPDNCQTSLIFAKGYNIQQLSSNSWLIINSEPLQITINCKQRNTKTEIVFKNSVLQLQPGCNAYIGVTKVQADSNDFSEASVDTHPILIPFDCCENIPDNIEVPKLQPLKLNNFNVEDLDIAKHKLEEYSKSLDDLINEPFVSKHISWFTKRRHLALTSNSPPPPHGPRRSFKSLRNILPRRRPSIRPEEDLAEEETIELN
ncbi:hypothetical protein NQ317_019134 [Molorchus minor]|uniref:Integrase catalytic domain-containing protein n=1 Tax=Molorchus minor TaxID=1323400 RepID=A0ABQ9JIX1_9CUCU|nr:hypothetical protein NQ317_019134 [Molorchus minor]